MNWVMQVKEDGRYEKSFTNTLDNTSLMKASGR